MCYIKDGDNMNDNYDFDSDLRRKVVDLDHRINSMSITKDRNYINSMHRIINDTYEFYYSYHYNCNEYTNQSAVNAVRNARVAIDIVERLALIIDDCYSFKTDDYIGVLESMRRETFDSCIRYSYPTLYSNIVSTINIERDRAIERDNLRKISSPKIDDKIDKDFDKIDRDFDKPKKIPSKIDQLNEMLDDKIDTFSPKIDRIGGRRKFM